jgi:hypothetical protein
VRAGASQNRASSTPRTSPDSGIHGFIMLDRIEYMVRIYVEIVGQLGASVELLPLCSNRKPGLRLTNCIRKYAAFSQVKGTRLSSLLCFKVLAQKYFNLDAKSEHAGNLLEACG